MLRRVGSDCYPTGMSAQSSTAAPYERALRALAAACDARAAVAAVEELHDALWGGMLAALREPSAEEVAELATRLAHLSAALLGASLAEGRRGPGAARETGERAGQREPVARAQEPGVPLAEPRGRGWIVDERATGHAPPESEPPAESRWAGPTVQAARGAPPLPAMALGEIALRDERAHAAGAPAWLGVIARELRRFELDHRPFAVLVLELRDLERLRIALAPQELERLGEALEQAITETLPAGVEPPVAQSPGREWLLLPGCDGAAARAVAERMVAAVRVRVPAAPGGVIGGVAVCPWNGRTVPALAAHADVDLYAARRPLERAG